MIYGIPNFHINLPCTQEIRNTIPITDKEAPLLTVSRIRSSKDTRQSASMIASMSTAITELTKLISDATIHTVLQNKNDKYQHLQFVESGLFFQGSRNIKEKV